MQHLSFDTIPALFADVGGLWDSVINLLVALWGILVSLIGIAAPFLPLVGWIAFWLFAVNWVKLREVMIEGGWIGVVLIGIVTVIVWGTVAPPPDGNHYLLGLTVSNFVGKFVYVTILFCIMFLCGTVQLGGFLPACCQFEEQESAAAEEHGDDH